MMANNERMRFITMLSGLVLCAVLLIARLVYLVLMDPLHFPINTVKVVANYQHITHKELQSVLTPHLGESFFALSTRQLKNDLMALTWTKDVQIKRIWPDTLKIMLIERVPFARWNNALISSDGSLFGQGKTAEASSTLPQLRGPESQQKDVLQIYEKLSKLLSSYGLSMASLRLEKSQAWDLSLMNGIIIRLGKRDIEERLLRFCKAYPAVFADKSDELSSVDLRYAHGMAVQWKQQTGK